jgi:ABC-2 type transport system permease protein
LVGLTAFGTMNTVLSTGTRIAGERSVGWNRQLRLTPLSFHDIAEALPSFWLVQASHVAIGGGGWSARGWLIMAAWSVVLAAAAGWAYRRDTSGCNGRTGARHRVRCQAPL